MTNTCHSCKMIKPDAESRVMPAGYTDILCDWCYQSKLYRIAMGQCK